MLCGEQESYFNEENKNCYSELEINKYDIISIHHNSSISYGVICPICGCFTPIHYTKTPSKILNQVKKEIDGDKFKTYQSLKEIINKYTNNPIEES